VKAWCTDLGVEIASMGVQVHGGMGFIEETGAAQHLRDARITPIYEGTNGIQANDLVGRKLLRDRGEAARELLADLRVIAHRCESASGEELALIGRMLGAGIDALEDATTWMVATGGADLPRALAGSAPCLKLMGIVVSGALLAQGALAVTTRVAAGAGDAAFHQAKLATARFFAEHVLATAPSFAPAIRGGTTTMSFDLELL